LIDQILLDTTVASQEVRDKQLGKRWLFVDHAGDVCLCYSHDYAFRHSGDCCQTLRLSGHPRRSRRDAAVNRMKLPAKLRRSLACTNSIENMMGTVRRVCRNVKRWRNTAMALRWTAAGMMEAAKGFRRLKAYRLLPILRAALVAHATEHVATKEIEPQTDAA
jgi:hypothetical protein